MIDFVNGCNDGTLKRSQKYCVFLRDQPKPFLKQAFSNNVHVHMVIQKEYYKYENLYLFK